MSAVRNSTIILYLTLILLSTEARTQSWYFRNYQVNNGISSNTITSITQDKKGFLWFGTRNGLNRFDGNSFRIFRNNLSDSGSIGSNSILSLQEDEQEQLWVGTYKGIYLYDPVLERFRPFRKLPAGEIRYIKGDAAHNIWIVADFALYKVHAPTGKVTAYPFEHAQTIGLYVTETGTVWAATNNGLIKKYDAARDRFISYDVSKDINTMIQDVYPVNDSTLIIGTMNQALWYDIPRRNGANIFKDFHDVQVHKILRQSEHEYWFGTENGLYIYDRQSDHISLLQKKYNNPYAVSDNVIYSFYKDKEGGTWIGTFFGGINYYAASYNQFTKYFPASGTHALSGSLVHEITPDDSHHLWIGTEDAGLNKLDTRSGAIEHFMPGQGPGSIAYPNIHGLVAAGNELWIGTYEHGLDVMNIQTGKVIRHYDAHKDKSSFGSNFIVALYRTRGGDILVGTWGGLFKYKRASDNFEQLPFFQTQIQAIHEDAKGVIWASTYGNGVYYYDPVTDKGGTLKSTPGGLVNNYVNNLYEDSRGQMWFCTEGGLCRYIPTTGKFTTYTIDDGLPDNQVFRVLEDDAHQLWVSTSKGLMRFDPVSGKKEIFTVANGLLTEQFNYNSAYKSPDGTLYFGSVKGMISFNPATFTIHPYVPPVYITGLEVNNKPVIAGAKDSFLQQSITYTPHLTLPYDRSSIALDAAALSYAIPEMNGYRYKMEGLDKEWTYLKSNRRIYYTKLPPGDYTFKVTGCSGEGVWNNQETTLSITVLPPYWASGWAYLLYGIIGAGIVFIIFRYYHIAMDEKNKRKMEALEIEKERDLYNAKIDFFTNVAHEIRTPLTLIKMPLDKLLQQIPYNTDINESLNMMKKNTNRLIDLTNQLLDFRKAEANNFSLTFIKTDINEFLQELFDNFKPAAEQKNVSFKLELPRLTLHAWVDAEALKKMGSNLISNAIKYADHTVLVKLLPFGSEDSMFHIEVRNDGFIIPYELRDKIFEPFYRIKETEKQLGTGIGLSLSRTLAELHKGILELKPTNGALNIFQLTLPIHPETETELPVAIPVEAPVAATAPDAVGDPGKPLLLLVEDNKEISVFIQRELSVVYQVLKAYNGQEALDILQKENVQVVISDIMMPVMDGIELCRRMKTDLQYSHIPIILLTAKNTLHSKIEGLEVGADAYIEKPFSFEHLMAQIANLINNRTIIKEYFARSPLTHIKGIACSNADKQFLEQLNNVINERIADMELDVDQLSKLMNISRPTLYRKINALSNLTPNELINLSRLKKAAELLAEGSYKINEVANMVGYSLQTNFSRDFHKQFGVTPSAYISSLQQ